MSTWFDIKARAEAEADVFLYDEIGGFGVNARDFISQIRASGAKKINLRINSPGGSVFDGLAIFNFLKEQDVTVQVDGLAASIASIIAMAGKEVRIASNGFLMIHNPWGGAMGDSEEMRQTADLLDKIRDSLVGTYAKKTGKDEETIKRWMDEETWFSAEEAKEHGFVDTITDEVAFSASVRSFKKAPAILNKPSTTAPDAAKRAFRKGIQQVEDGKAGDGLEPTTIKEARALADGETPTEAKVRKANRWWARNERFLDAEADSPADVSANLWGGAAGRDWFRAKYAELERQEDDDDLDNNNNNDMEKLLNALAGVGLVPSAQIDEDAAVAAFTAAFASVTETHKTAIEALTSERDALKAKLDEAAKVEISNKVETAIKEGRIKSDLKDQWIAQISADSSALELLNSISAPVIGAEPVGAPAAKTSVDLRAEFDAITDPKKRSAFWSANKAQLLKK
jgi:ATP-dependent Clp endopeptidase proteolytic subunit ClpP